MAIVEFYKPNIIKNYREKSSAINSAFSLLKAANRENNTENTG